MTAMDEHDKRAEAMLSVASDGRVFLEPEPTFFVALGDGGQEALDCIAPVLAMALRSTAAAAVAAERERCARVCDDEAVEAGRGRPNTVGCARMLAARIRSAPAQAEQRVSERHGASATARLGALLAEAGATVTITPELVGSNGDPDTVQRVQQAHTRGVTETTSRLAARLRARADEAQAARRLALADALRSEADALEQGKP